MRRSTVVAAGVLTLSLAGCGGGGVGAGALAASVTTTFGNLYVHQQELLGRPGRFVSDVDPLTTCTRAGGPGSGSDWRCVVLFRQEGQATRAEYDVRVTPTGCYAADGPPTVVGPAEIRTPRGETVVNPLAGFDGCLDPSRPAA